MELVFWQSILSIHQSTFLNALSKEHDVTLVVERETDQVRKESGWENPALNCKRVVVAPDESQVVKLIGETAGAVHVISGLDMTFREYQLTKRLTDKSYKVICYLEPFRWLGIKGAARKIKYSILRFKYGNRISAMLPTGNLGVKQYESIGFRNVFEWGYFTELSPYRKAAHTADSTSRPKLLFVGSLDERKNIISLIKVMSEPKFKDIHLSIVGDGPLRNEVIALASRCSNIEYLGVKPNDEVRRIMDRHDILILPSLFDGWGAVVNEALSCGMRVICSDRCGAATLLGESWRGSVFSFNHSSDLVNTIACQLQLGSQSETQRTRVINWCETHISGDIAAKYFIDICNYKFLGVGPKPIAPWKID